MDDFRYRLDLNVEELFDKNHSYDNQYKSHWAFLSWAAGSPQYGDQRVAGEWFRKRFDGQYTIKCYKPLYDDHVFYLSFKSKEERMEFIIRYV